MFFFVLMLAASVPSQQTPGLPLVHTYGDIDAENTIVSIPVRGVILSGTAADPLQTLFGQSYADGEQIKEQLRYLADDSSVDAVILEVDSPGGMITASKAIADGVKYYKETARKPVYTHINGSGASGAYWVASTTDEIYAEQGSESGSIGVIMGPLVTLKNVVSYGEFSATTPIGFKYYTAGRSKDIGNPFRDITTEEDAFINQQLTVEYDKFVAHVAAERGISAESIKGEIGALSYGTDDAIRLKLIDGQKSKEEVYAQLAEKAGIADDYKIMQIDSAVDFFGSLFSAKQFVESLRMSEADRSAGRLRFCETSLAQKPLVYSGDISAVCR
jgi:protease-4